MRVLILSVLLLFEPSSYAAELPDFTGLAETSKPSVVNISTSRAANNSNTPPPEFRLPPDMQEGPWGDLFRRFFEEPGDDGLPHPGDHSLGSGFIISADGYIVTNHHVVNEADEIIVRLDDRRELRARLIGSDPLSDTALIKIDATDLKPVKIGDSAQLKVGEWVLAIGSPFGFDYSVTAGIVSAKGRSLMNQNYVPFLQTDVAVNPGNSGGPLLNLQGQVVGVNSQIFSNTGGFMGLSFAIPIELVLEVVEQLKAGGYVSRGWLGVMIQEVTRELAESFNMDRPRGALVAKIVDKGPAAAAGIKVGDIIIEFNGQAIEDSSSLPPLVGRVRAGESATVKILREGRTRMLTLKVGKLPDDPLVAANPGAKTAKPAKAGRLGLVLEDTDDRLRAEYNLDGGALVVDIQTGPAAAAGFRSGDVIASLNNNPIRGAADFIEKLDKLKAGSSVAVLVQRPSGPIYLALRIPKNE
ncbi:MAG TPA: DegQ family serine endoprotease [Gammaproteobacteria bacterium]